MFNEITLIGRLGTDPEERVMQNGDKVVSFSFATSDSWKDQATGERKERTEWHRVVVFNQRLVPTIMNYLKKGSQAFLRGKIRTRKWVDASTSVERYVTEVVLDRFDSTLILLGGNSSGERAPALGGSQMFGNDFVSTQASTPQTQASSFKESVGMEDDDIFKDHIPF